MLYGVDCGTEMRIRHLKLLLMEKSCIQIEEKGFGVFILIQSELISYCMIPRAMASRLVEG